MHHPTITAQFRNSVYEIIRAYSDNLDRSRNETVLAMLRWSLSNGEDGYNFRQRVPNEKWVSIRVDPAEINRLIYGQSLQFTYLVERAAFKLPMPPKPELLAQYLPLVEVARRQPSSKATVSFSKRQTAHLRHLATAWDVTAADVVRVLVASHPCMHLPVVMSPPEVMAALRGIQSLPPANDQEVFVIEGAPSS